jgi:hypothetical protein
VTFVGILDLGYSGDSGYLRQFYGRRFGMFRVIDPEIQ